MVVWKLYIYTTLSSTYITSTLIYRYAGSHAVRIINSFGALSQFRIHVRSGCWRRTGRSIFFLICFFLYRTKFCSCTNFIRFVFHIYSYVWELFICNLVFRLDNELSLDLYNFRSICFLVLLIFLRRTGNVGRGRKYCHRDDSRMLMLEK